MRARSVAAFLSLIVAPVTAQEVLTVETCRDVISLAAGGQSVEAPDVTLDDGWCVAPAVVLGAGFSRSEAGPVRFRGAGLERLIADMLPPVSFEIEVTDFRVAPDFGSPLQSYLLSIQQGDTGISFGGRYDWTAGNGTLDVSQFYADLYEGNALSGSLQISGLDLSDMASLEASLPAVRFERAELTAALAGAFEAYAVLPLGNLLLQQDTDTPAADVARLQAVATGVIASVPDPVFDAGTRAALTRLVADMPTPRGSFDLTIETGEGIGMQELAPIAVGGVENGLDLFWDNIPDTRVTVRWETDQ